ncbi:proline iminopeptidase-family hydrolase [Sphingomonas sp. CFBP 13728]|nr:proline iminopeptidase-family hydrolase [Sphingomonas sp. CFBP 13728]
MHDTDRRTFVAGFLATAAIPVSARAMISSYPDAQSWHMETRPEREGMAPGPNGPVYYRLYGKTGGRPLIVLHGGPAAGEIYMRPYAGLAVDRQVVLYDQTGCGRSAKPGNLAGYTPDAYVSELEALRDHLGFEQVSLLGHSWGGFLGVLYATAYPDRVASLVLAGTATSMNDFSQAADRWLNAFGPSARTTIARQELPPAEPTPAYEAAYEDLTEAYYRRHLLRLDPWPGFFMKVGAALAVNPVYTYLNGPSEFQLTGKLATLDISSELKRIAVPTLVTCGEFDEAPPWVATKIVRLMANATLAVFPGASHMAHIEQPELVMAATSRFLRSSDRASSQAAR